MHNLKKALHIASYVKPVKIIVMALPQVGKPHSLIEIRMHDILVYKVPLVFQ